jgi:hypothetical protein
LFSQTESRDELGIGQIRDAFSDLLFPGTSVVQTRARYFLFIPWCYTAGTARGTTGSQNQTRGEIQERRLIKALLDARLEDATGLIGSRVGPSVKNLPSTIYWSGMQTYGIRAFGGAIGELPLATGLAEGATELSDRAVTEWDPGTPQAPEGFPWEMRDGFRLTSGEAEWLRGRMVAAAPDSLLAFLLERGTLLGDDVHYPWQAVAPGRFEEVDHADWFSSVMQGAPLLYNLLVAEKYVAAGLTRFEDPVGTYRERLSRWEIDFVNAYRGELDRWDIERMWSITSSANPNIDPRAERFVESWIAGIRSSSSLADDQALRRLIRSREERKGNQSRLLNEKMLATWSGAAGVGRLAFRWGTVRVLVNDILRGLIDDVGA